MGSVSWAVVAAGATVVVALAGAGVPHGFWDNRMPLFGIAVAVLALSGIKPAITRALGERSAQRERDIVDALKAAYVQIVEGTELDWKEIGLHAFVVRRSWPRVWREHQVRVGRWRLKSTPAVASGVRWTLGKGLIGRCWELKKNVGANVTAEWGTTELTEAEWEALDPSLRYGLSHEEYQRVRDYGAIVATPILNDDGRYLGCISADAPGDTYDQLWADSVMEALHDAGLWVKQTVRKLSRS